MQGTLYNNPAFAQSLSGMLGAIFPSAQETAAAELGAAQAGLANDERRYRAAIGEAGGRKDLAGLLVAALQGGEGAAAPGIASSLASLPQYGYDRATQSQIAVGTGTQAAQNTFAGLDQVLGNERVMQQDLFGHNVDMQDRKWGREDQLTARADEAYRGALASALGGGLIGSESGGDFTARNSAVGSGGHVGHFGRGQFGVARLEDAKRAGILPSYVTPEMFAQDTPQARMWQQATEQWHRDDILANAAQNGTYGLIGTQIMGIPVTEQGLINVAHLGGTAGARRFFETGGAYNPADANGTRLSDYLALGARESGAQAQPTSGQGLDDPRYRALLEAAGSPYMTETQSGILTDLMGVLMPKPGEPFTLGPNERRYSGTGSLIASGPAPEPKGAWRSATPEEAASYGAVAGQFSPDGKFDPINPPSGMSVEIGPDGQARVLQGPGVSASARPLNEGQSKNVIYATRAEGALAELEPNADAMTGLKDSMAEKGPLGLGRYLQSEDFQMANQAGLEFLAAILRKDTGAAVTPSETQIYGDVYLPRPGDTPGVLAQKKASRARAVEALRRGMTPAEILALEKPMEGAGAPPPSEPPNSGATAAPAPATTGSGVKWRIVD